jgi:Rrf2 family protein
MRISVKGRYGLASMISMAQNSASGEYITVISISEKLGISKIYLEQVFSLLKRSGLVTSAKGAQGGYSLARPPQQITVYDILTAVELSLFEKAEDTVSKKASEIDAAMNTLAFTVLDDAVKCALQKATLYDMVHEADKQKKEQALMYFI